MVVFWCSLWFGGGARSVRGGRGVVAAHIYAELGHPKVGNPVGSGDGKEAGAGLDWILKRAGRTEASSAETVRALNAGTYVSAWLVDVVGLGGGRQWEGRLPC